MKRFRLPRKTKKSLKGNLWLYPTDEKGNSLMAHPTTSQEDYLAIKQGIVKNLLERSARPERKERRKKLDQEILVSDEELRNYVDDIIRKYLRISSYNKLIEAKNNPKARVAYYNFINAYHLCEKGESSFGNICCLSIDLAIKLLKEQKRKKKKERRYKYR